MVNLDAVIASLLSRRATVTSVGHSIGILERRRSGGFYVRPEDKHFASILIGINENQSEANAPNYVDLRTDDSQPFSLAEMLPNCTDWKTVPSNSISSQFVYGFHAKSSTEEVGVNIIVTLSGTIDDSSSKVERVLLQRNPR